MLALSSCSEQGEDALLRHLERNSWGLSPAVRVIKSGPSGDAWLLTVHGYADNQSVCQELIKPYNEDASLSVLPGAYRCEEIRAR